MVGLGRFEGFVLTLLFPFLRVHELFNILSIKRSLVVTMRNRSKNKILWLPALNDQKSAYFGKKNSKMQ